MDSNLTNEKKNVLSFFRRLFSLACVFYLIVSILYFIFYILLFDDAFRDIIRGGISVAGHAVFFGICLLISLIITLIRRKKPEKKSPAAVRYLIAVSVSYTLMILVLITVYGFYLDMLYNEHDVTKAAILKGPSFLLSFACFCCSVCLPFVNRIYKTRLVGAFKVILHLICVLILVGVFFYFLSDGFSSTRTFLIFSAMLAFLYTAITLLYYLFAGAIKKDANEEQEYTSVYLTKEYEKERLKEAKKKK